MDKYEHKILLNQILRKRKITIPLKISYGTFSYPPKFDRMGESIAEEVWEVLSDEADYFKLDFDDFGRFKIYTSWLGFDNSLINLPDSEENFIFRTTLILDDEILDSSFFYNSEESALKNHRKLVFMADQKMLTEIMES
jgi:hypothetical protein